MLNEISYMNRRKETNVTFHYKRRGSSDNLHWLSYEGKNELQ
eukprot:CAMPEP_0196243268 /NCGR_PEP_ID=MMETSP0913-20130531/27442_1 /TAXON_ID=49265 /ORGANISM="Thalassiosira rotula, Strain GSO102" /LENGTH=41 /DNA_ID= /DNA_START= /DNA_END= /DNA_ORIENTATION=